MSILKIASDHAGFEEKSKVISFLKRHDIQIIDLGPSDESRVDYPDFADKVCSQLESSEKGLLICGSGQGMAMRANKYPLIRAALCWSEESAKLAREHNNANVLCLGARLLEDDLIRKIIVTFLNTEFAGGRHSGRVEKISTSL